MTIDEAKKRLEVWLKCGECPEDKRCYDSYLHSTCEYTDYCDEVSIVEAVKVAIEALEQEPCENCISRQAVLDLAEWFDLNRQHFIVANLIDEVENMPSVTQQRMGHWILSDEQNNEDVENDNYHFICSECQCSDIHAKGTKVSYCWNCGAKMEVEA